MKRNFAVVVFCLIWFWLVPAWAEEHIIDTYQCQVQDGVSNGLFSTTKRFWVNFRPVAVGGMMQFPYLSWNCSFNAEKVVYANYFCTGQREHRVEMGGGHMQNETDAPQWMAHTFDFGSFGNGKGVCQEFVRRFKSRM